MKQKYSLEELQKETDKMWRREGGERKRKQRLRHKMSRKK